MREIKFRAWDKENKSMVYVRDNCSLRLFDDGSGAVVFNCGESAGGDYDMVKISKENLMQFTGLLDKKGKEIYEGDIVLTQAYTDKPYSRKKKQKKHIGVVVYQIGAGDGFFNNETKEFNKHQEYSAGWTVKIEDYRGFGCSNWGAFYDCEVIGNLYENPELLNTNTEVK